MRGEHSDAASKDVSEGGSSPHARGALSYRFECLHDCGVIPACAGSIVNDSLNFLTHGGHPRMRGEHT